MSQNATKTPVVQTPQDLLQEICAPHILPDERADTFEALREALFSDLAPATPYETLLAEQLVALEWDALRHRRMHDSLLRAEFREQAMDVFEGPQTGLGILLDRSDEARDLAFDLVSHDQARREAALAGLEAREIPPEEILARAYQKLARDLEPHARQIAEIETRRRKLRAEYDGVKALRAAPVDDAEVLEG